MDLIKKLAIGAATVSLAAGSLITPVFADADASNDNIDNGSFAKSKAWDNDTYVVVVTNKKTKVKTTTVVLANTGANDQSGNKDGNTMTTGKAKAWGESNVAVNVTEINF